MKSRTTGTWWLSLDDPTKPIFRRPQFLPTTVQLAFSTKDYFNSDRSICDACFHFYNGERSSNPLSLANNSVEPCDPRAEALQTAVPRLD